MAIFAVIHPDQVSDATFDEMYAMTFAVADVGGKASFTPSANPRIFTAAVLHSFPSSLTRILYQGYIRPTSLNVDLFAFYEGSTAHVQISLDASGFLVAKRFTTTLTTSSVALSVDTWYYIQVDVTISNTVGAVKVLIDTVEAINITGQDTQQSGTGIIDGFGLRSGTYGECFLADTSGSDFNALSTELLAISIIRPDGAGNSAQWTPSAGSNYQTVDEDPVSETDYNESSTNTHKDTFAMASAPTEVVDVICVVPWAIAERTDVTPASINMVARHSSSEAAGADNSLIQNSLRMYQSFAHVNPSTAVAWTETEVNAMEAGYELSV